MAFDDTTQYNYSYVDVKQYIADALTAELQTSVKYPVRVFKSDPVDATSIPAIGINIVNTDEDTSGIGLVSQPPEYDSTTKLYTVYKGVFMREGVEVRVFHTVADERDNLRILVLATLFSIREDLLQKGLREIKLSGGRDEQDNVLLQSSPLFMNGMVMSYINPLDVWVQTTLDAITDVIPSGTPQNSNPLG